MKRDRNDCWHCHKTAVWKTARENREEAAKWASDTEEMDMQSGATDFCGFPASCGDEVVHSVHFEPLGL